MQKQLSCLTVEKMKLAQQVGLLEAENASLRQKWMSHFEQWGRHSAGQDRSGRMRTTEL